MMILAAVILFTFALAGRGRWKQCAPYWWWDGDRDRIRELEDELEDLRDQLDLPRSTR